VIVTVNEYRSEATVPSTIRIIRAHDFMKATPEGWLDRHQSMKLLLDIAAIAPELTDFHVILDSRKAQSGLNETDLWYLASELKNHFRDISQSPKMPCFILSSDSTRQRSSRFVRRTGVSISVHSLNLRTHMNG
jgi:hypothetical protein